MSRNLESTSKLTEFAPLSPEDKSSFGLLGFSKFFKLGKGEGSEPDAGNDKGNNLVDSEWQQPNEDMEQSEAASLQYSVDISEGRSLPNVLKRLSNLVALKNVGLTSYKDTDLKQYWMPDSFSKECYDCGEKFTTFRRRHHCRVCGQIFCSRCCNQEIPGKIMNCTGDLRVCTYCCKVVLSYLQSADIGADLSTDLRALQEDLQTKFGNQAFKNTENSQPGISSINNTEREETSTVRRKPSVGYQEERFALGRAQSPSYLSEEERCRALQNSSSLRSLYEEVIRQPTGITLQSHRYRLRTYPNCFFGSELVDWLINQNKAGTRVQGIAIGQALLEAGYLEPIGELDFMDNLSLYRPGPLKPVATPQGNGSNEGQEPLWVKQISQQDSVNTTDSESENRLSEIEEEPDSKMPIAKSNSNYYLDINFKDNVVHVSRPSPPSQEEIRPVDKFIDRIEGNMNDNLQRRSSDVVLNTDWDKTSYVRSNEGEDPLYQNLNSAFEHHRQTLLRQMLNTEGLSQSWSDVILPITDNIIQLVRPDMKNDVDEMDIRHYVQIKKLPGGQRNESSIISGVVCSKNVAHRSMRTRINNPKILLLRCSVVYQRIEGRLLSLEPVMMQEHEYLRQIVARIAALQPDIVMVYRNVSRLAQEYLLKLGITLILNTKLNVLDRVARFTQADMVASMDAHISKPKLGTCQSFYLKTFQTENGASKTLMFFEGCSNPELSCTLLLRGGTNSELTKLKKIVSFIVFASYNWKLERSFIMDEFAKPPGPPPELFRESPDPDSKSPNIQTENKSECKIRPAEKEDKKVLIQSVQDCSDPLQSYLNSADDVFPKQLEPSPIEEFSVAELPFSNKFRKSLDDTILSISLYVKYSVPYLETEAGRNCVLRKYFPNEIFYSKQFSNNSELNRTVSSTEQTFINTLEAKLRVKLLPIHPFVTAKITDTVASMDVQTLLALYRANGGRIPLKIDEKDRKEAQENIKNEIKNLNQNQQKKLDVLDPVNHQKLPVLFCSYSYSSQNSPAFCVDPWIVKMYFYGQYDIPLGSFLERYCFRPSYVCPSLKCDTPMLEHVRRFVHDPGAVHLTLSELDQLDSKEIVMWSWCTKCKVPTPMVPMSSDTWSFSFAKYLDLRFRGHIYTRRDMETCKHSLHHNHYQYFGMNKIVASFKFSPVRIWEIFLPPSVIKMQFDSAHQNVIMDELRSLAIKGHDVYSSVLEKLVTLEGSEEDVQSMKHQQQKEQAHFKAKIEEIQMKLTSPILENKKFEGSKSDKEVEYLLWRIEDSVIYLKRMISEAVIGWNARFQDAVNAVKKKDDKEKEKSKRSSEGTLKPLPHTVPLLDGQENEDETEDLINDAVFETSAESLRRLSDNIPDSADNDSEDSLSFRGAESGDHDEKSSDDAKDRKSYSDVISINFEDSQVDSKQDKKTVKTILSQILTSNKDLAQVSSPWSAQEHYLLPPGPNACIMVHENEPSSIISYALASYDYQRYLEENQHKKNLAVSTEMPVASPVNRRKTISSSSTSEKESESTENRKSAVLSFLRGANIPQSSTNRSSIENTASPNVSAVSDNGSSVLTDQDENKEESKKNKASSSCHVEIMFGDSSANFYCRIYFAEQFAALRQIVFPVGEEAFVRSLSRCVQWAARGGKSGSTFCKTKDDRFILKEMSKLELQLFLDFASHYFSYIQKCRENNQPTLLGKIVGVYTVSFRNTNSNSALKSNLLVMENLFYRRNVTQKYDLKGSVRNRLVNPSIHNEGEIVYLDENLLKMTTDSPLYILPHSQAVLMRAIESDTQFLASQTVMDYSLLVGLDEDRRELVIGIIDYIRTFTWDKKIETIVKKSVIMGGQGKQPTIIQPKDYRDRFIAAMHRYFLPVPDRWSGLDS